MKPRTLEAIVAGYSGLSGALFILSPDALSSPVYEPWHVVGVAQWGLLLMLVSSLHFVALALNGRDRLISMLARSAALAGHLVISLTFAIYYFLGAALWGCVLFGFLLPLLTFPLCDRVFSEWVLVAKGKAPRNAEHY